MALKPIVLHILQLTSWDSFYQGKNLKRVFLEACLFISQVMLMQGFLIVPLEPGERAKENPGKSGSCLMRYIHVSPPYGRTFGTSNSASHAEL